MYNKKKYYYKWCVLLMIILSSSSLNTSDIKGMDFKKSKQWSFNAKEGQETQIQLLYEDNKVEKIDAEVLYSGSLLQIKALEAINMEKFQNKGTLLTIDYYLEESSQESDKTELGKAPSSQRNSELTETINNKKVRKILLRRTEDEPFWRISNGNGSWGIGVPSLGIPDFIKKLLVDNKIYFYGMNNMYHNSDGTLQGTITLYTKPGQYDITKYITLDNLDLPKDITKKLKTGNVNESTLEIVANYELAILFEIPNGIVREKEEKEKGLCTEKMQITNEISIRYLIKVKQ